MTDTPRENPAQILARLRRQNGATEDKATIEAQQGWAGTGGDRIEAALATPIAPSYDTSEGADILYALRADLNRDHRQVETDVEKTRAWRESALQALGASAAAKANTAGEIG